MSQQVQELIDKIKEEGIQTAQQKGKEIEAQAQKQAQKIIDAAQRQADQIVVEAKKEVKKMQESTTMALKQASRDTLLSLRKEINNLLKKIVTTHVGESFSDEHLVEVLEAVIKHALDGKTHHGNIQVAVNPHDLEKVKRGFVGKLKDRLKEPIRFEGSQDIGKGFTISFDGGKSAFDFTDAALAEFISTYLNSEMASLVKEAVK